MRIDFARIDTVRLDDTLERFFSRLAPVEAGDRLLVAFSGGPDSTALLAALRRFAEGRGLDLLAAHLDHGLDDASADRARGAAGLAGKIGVPLVAERREVLPRRRPGESIEAAARRIRYAFLETVRRETGSRWVATAHHRDDQAETVLLRLRFGTGPEGLAGIQPVRGRVVRPLLDLPRRDLASALAQTGLAPLVDPTNTDLSLPRNRVRRRTLPALEAAEPGLSERLAGIASLAGRARDRLRERLESHLDLRLSPQELSVRRRRFAALPAELQSIALAILHRRAGAPFPPHRPAREELLRQLSGGDVRDAECGVDCGGGLRWEGRDDRLALVRPQPSGTPPGDFNYTFEAPGELEMGELHLRARLTRGVIAPWMFEGSPLRAGLALPLSTGDRVEIRNRRPGDRLRPLGAAGSRRLKDVLIDHRVPRRERETLPLWIVGGRIAWVPGVTIEDRFRIGSEREVWIAEMEAV